MAGQINWLKRILKGSLAGVPFVGGLLVEGTDAWFEHCDSKPDLADIERVLRRVVLHSGHTDRIVDALGPGRRGYRRG